MAGSSQQIGARDMNDRDRTVIATLKRQGRGRIRISDIRKAAGLRDTGGDEIAQRLMKEGSLRRIAWDHYELTGKPDEDRAVP